MEKNKLPESTVKKCREWRKQMIENTKKKIPVLIHNIALLTLNLDFFDSDL